MREAREKEGRGKKEVKDWSPGQEPSELGWMELKVALIAMGREPWPSGTVHLCGYLAARSLFCSLQGHGAQSSVAMRPLSGYMTLHKPIERHANQQPPWFFIIGEAIFV